jgi:DNA-binding CsgD family transcriptional regulator
MSAVSTLVDKPFEERRRGRRRTGDRLLSIVSELAAWFAERSPEPLFVVDRVGRVMFSNDGARRLAAEARVVSVRDDTLTFVSRRLQAAFDTARRDAGTPTAVDTQHQRVRYRVVFHGIELSGNTMLLVVGVQPLTGFAEFGRLLEQVAGLTSAESDVAAHLCAGEALAEIAAARGASVNTVKTQTRQVFQKCGVRSRVELIRRLFELVMSRPGAAAAFSVPLSGARARRPKTNKSDRSVQP